MYPSKGAAQSTLASAYMTMAGYPLNKGAEYYKLAAEQSKAVIDNESTYGLSLESDTGRTSIQ